VKVGALLLWSDSLVCGGFFGSETQEFSVLQIRKCEGAIWSKGTWEEGMWEREAVQENNSKRLRGLRGFR
jgi:hypothetical protein